MVANATSQNVIAVVYRPERMLNGRSHRQLMIRQIFDTEKKRVIGWGFLGKVTSNGECPFEGLRGLAQSEMEGEYSISDGQKIGELLHDGKIFKVYRFRFHGHPTRKAGMQTTAVINERDWESYTLTPLARQVLALFRASFRRCKRISKKTKIKSRVLRST